MQVRTDDAEACIAKLREGGLSGFVFRGDHGWLTVVPYGIPGESEARRPSTFSGSTSSAVSSRIAAIASSPVAKDPVPSLMAQ